MVKTKYDLSGMKFGRLKVLEQAEDYVYPNGKRRAAWRCQCDCGNVVVCEQSNLRTGNTKSCGCLNNELVTTRSKTHGDRHTRLYSIWTNMRSRCNNPKALRYENYGGRGITICEEWLNYENFKKWALKSGYDDSLSIDRINVNGDYCPENCRWATCREQSNNRRNTLTFTINNETHTLSEWASLNGIKYHTLFARIYKLGWSLERSLGL